jgi:protein-disulfide isomerase
VSRRRILFVGAFAPILLAGALIGASQLGAREERRAAAPATKLLAGGIPQQGAALGFPTAPVTLVEYADLQCPFCGEWARNVFPQLVRDYVRTGKLRIVYQGLAFIGPDSYTALQTAVAAGQQGHLWDVVHSLFERQGAENMGWVDEELLGEVVRDAGIGNVSLGPAVDAAIQSSARQARAGGIQATPSFEIGRTGQRLRRLQLTSLAPEAFTSEIDALLSK